ncbi:MAG: 50S ribosomal protein L10 [Chloroflexi bacterium]|nr:50S ribosomal protein L10 [Chloroflexota bacterium]
MPTEAKINAVEELKQIMKDCSIAIATDYSGTNVSDINMFRTALRNEGIKYKIVKNTLLKIAADDAGKPEMKELIDGPTGIAFGYGDEQLLAKTLFDFIKKNNIEIVLKTGVIGSDVLTSEDIISLATLPSKEELVAKLIGQLQGQISSLVFVINAPLVNVARVLESIKNAKTEEEKTEEPEASVETPEEEKTEEPEASVETPEEEKAEEPEASVETPEEEKTEEPEA